MKEFANTLHPYIIQIEDGLALDVNRITSISIIQGKAYIDLVDKSGYECNTPFDEILSLVEDGLRNQRKEQQN